MSSIHTLVPDIQHLLTRKDGWFTDELARSFSQSVASRLQVQFQERTGPNTLRLSRMGLQCPHALWLSIHKPELAEKMQPWVENKFSFGHIIEAWAIALSKAAGHKVEGEQDVICADGVLGHRDCVVDGCILDVKSCSSPSFKKFENGTLAQDDLFGYLDQLDGYLYGSLADPLVTVKDKAYLLAIDKQLGHMAVYEHVFREQHIRERIREYTRIVGLPSPPACTCGVVEYGESGNLALDVRASYNNYKYQCFPNLRTFIYSKGPVYLTKVVKTPKNKGVPLLEVDQYGRPVL